MAGHHRVVVLWTCRAGPELGRMAGTQTLDALPRYSGYTEFSV